jgi:DNA helicase-2/ATP-dependent DNA helicase PcrA
VKKIWTSFRDELNPVQCEAVETTEGPVLVLAGAGSGKTRILTYRIVYLLLEKHIPPSQILAMTFTNKAAGEMKERVGRFIGKDKTIAVGTFHSIFSRLLRWEADKMGFTRNFVIYDADDQERLVKTVMEENGLAGRDISPRAVASAISRAKNTMVDGFHAFRTDRGQSVFRIPDPAAFVPGFRFR